MIAGSPLVGLGSFVRLVALDDPLLFRIFNGVGCGPLFPILSLRSFLRGLGFGWRIGRGIRIVRPAFKITA